MSVRILIVDDNAINMKLAADVLAGPDCEVACAGDAEQALALLAASLPDLILIDGGRGQLNAACAELARLGLGSIPVPREVQTAPFQAFTPAGPPAIRRVASRVSE